MASPSHPHHAPDHVVRLITAPNAVVAALWQQALAQEGIPSALRPAFAAFPYLTDGPYDVLVLDHHWEQARAVLNALAPEDAVD